MKRLCWKEPQKYLVRLCWFFSLGYTTDPSMSTLFHLSSGLKVTLWPVPPRLPFLCFLGGMSQREALVERKVRGSRGHGISCSLFPHTVSGRRYLHFDPTLISSCRPTVLAVERLFNDCQSLFCSFNLIKAMVVIILQYVSVSNKYFYTLNSHSDMRRLFLRKLKWHKTSVLNSV